MNRRGFLGRIGQTAAAVAIAPALAVSTTAPANPDDFLHGAYRVKWGGWQKPPNQSVRFGAWHAKHVKQDLEWVSTTMGQCYPSRAWEVFDTSLSREGGWPYPTLFLSEEEFDGLKQRARTALLEKLA